MDDKRWNKMPLLEQMSNIYGEIERFAREKSQTSYELAIKLLDFTINDSKHNLHVEEFILAKVEFEEYAAETNDIFRDSREKSLLAYWRDWVYYFVKMD